MMKVGRGAKIADVIFCEAKFMALAFWHYCNRQFKRNVATVMYEGREVSGMLPEKGNNCRGLFLKESSFYLPENSVSSI